ncbi:MAG TPA: ABC transporter ATP-binding protein, partial [Anaeromyxobacteraceae bacterium]|nr:ABC transporter ATP-binding protein [Anaeromyxobacteraceae bacterium]
MIRVRELVKEYRSGKVTVAALRGADFDVPSRCFTAVVGPSGCGKSTLLYVVGGMLRATSGSVVVDGFDVTAAREAALTAYRRASVGFVFQKLNLLGSLDVRDNLRIACRIARRSEGADARIDLLLESVGLAAKQRARPTELSQGEQQRVAIARALARQPALLLADEPTGNLDSASSRAIMALFRRLAAEHGPTILMITHDRDCAAFADAIIELRDG